MDAVLEQEYKKGEAAGILFARDFVNVRTSDLTEQIEELLKQQKEGDNANDIQSGT